MLLFMYILYIISTVVDWLSYIISLTLLYLIISLLLDLNMALQVRASDSAGIPSVAAETYAIKFTGNRLTHWIYQI